MNTKKISALLCAVMILSLFAFSACGSKSAYRDDVKTASIASSIDALMGGSGVMIEAPATYIAASVKIPVENYAEYSIRVNSMGINIDEYGIFKAKDAKQAQEIKSEIEAYFGRYKDRWMPEYMPGEYPKLENAEVKVFGNYVMYGLLSDDMRAQAFATFESALKK